MADPNFPTAKEKLNQPWLVSTKRTIIGSRCVKCFWHVTTKVWPRCFKCFWLHNLIPVDVLGPRYGLPFSGKSWELGGLHEGLVEEDTLSHASEQGRFLAGTVKANVYHQWDIKASIDWRLNENWMAFFIGPSFCKTCPKSWEALTHPIGHMEWIWYCKVNRGAAKYTNFSYPFFSRLSVFDDQRGPREFLWFPTTPKSDTIGSDEHIHTLKHTTIQLLKTEVLCQSNQQPHE